MNKFKEAKAWIDKINAHTEWTRCNIEEPALSQLTKLVELATPKNVVKDANYRGYYYRCPTCGNDLGVYSDIENYCEKCGQRLMRGDKND